jgi:hypothetical protein
MIVATMPAPPKQNAPKRVLHCSIVRRQLPAAADHRLLDDRGDDAGAAKTKRAEARFALFNCALAAFGSRRSSITR